MQMVQHHAAIRPQAMVSCARQTGNPRPHADLRAVAAWVWIHTDAPDPACGLWQLEQTGSRLITGNVLLQERADATTDWRMYNKEGRPYFHNSKTGQSSWSVPAEVAAARTAAQAEASSTASTVCTLPTLQARCSSVGQMTNVVVSILYGNCRQLGPHVASAHSAVPYVISAAVQLACRAGCNHDGSSCG